jgi:hypothetical protein
MAAPHNQNAKTDLDIEPQYVLPAFLENGAWAFYQFSNSAAS